MIKAGCITVSQTTDPHHSVSNHWSSCLLLVKRITLVIFSHLPANRVQRPHDFPSNLLQSTTNRPVLMPFPICARGTEGHWRPFSPGLQLIQANLSFPFQTNQLRVSASRVSPWELPPLPRPPHGILHGPSRRCSPMYKRSSPLILESHTFHVWYHGNLGFTNVTFVSLVRRRAARCHSAWDAGVWLDSHCEEKGCPQVIHFSNGSPRGSSESQVHVPQSTRTDYRGPQVRGLWFLASTEACLLCFRSWEKIFSDRNCPFILCIQSCGRKSCQLQMVHLMVLITHGVGLPSPAFPFCFHQLHPGSDHASRPPWGPKESVWLSHLTLSLSSIYLKRNNFWNQPGTVISIWKILLNQYYFQEVMTPLPRPLACGNPMNVGLSRLLDHGLS